MHSACCLCGDLAELVNNSSSKAVLPFPLCFGLHFKSAMLKLSNKRDGNAVMMSNLMLTSPSGTSLLTLTKLETA